MEVLLYVYDLSRGLARQMSMQFLGIQIDAIYHTSIVLGRDEYFYGAGIQVCTAGQSHHGSPMQIIKLGETSLPYQIIKDHIACLQDLYSAQSYDLFDNNCNNFTQDLSEFLVGKGIPEHIQNLPRQVLNTPFGQMLRPQIDASMRTVTQSGTQPQFMQTSNYLDEDSQNSSSRLSPDPLQQIIDTPRLDVAAYDVELVDETKDPDVLREELTSLCNSASASRLIDILSTKSNFDNQPLLLQHLGELFDIMRQHLSEPPPDFFSLALNSLKLLLVDERVSAAVAYKENDDVIVSLLAYAVKEGHCETDVTAAALDMACNYLSSSTSRLYIVAPRGNEAVIQSAMVQLAASNILDSTLDMQLDASSLAFNIAFANHETVHDKDLSKEDFCGEINEVVLLELAASLLEALSQMQADDRTAENMLLAFGLLLLSAPKGGDIYDLCRALDAVTIFQSKRKNIGGRVGQISEEIINCLELEAMVIGNQPARMLPKVSHAA